MFIFSTVDHIFDFMIALLFVGVLLYTVYALKKINGINGAAYKKIKIKYNAIFALASMVSLLYIFQAFFAFFNGVTSDYITLWDLINLLVALTLLTNIRTFTRMIGVNLKDDVPEAKRIPFI